jgi:8-oxo-dGTP diphosphatase
MSSTEPPSRPRQPGDGFVDCACGRRHWGVCGAAGLLLSQDGEVLLQHRAVWSHEGGTWGLPGGARRPDETPVHAALREAAEEAAVPAAAVRVTAAHVADHGTWTYTTVLADAVGPVSPYPADAESIALAWVPVDRVGAEALHSGFAAAWSAGVSALVGVRLTLVVDAANVVGSTPDGWWRDRPGATRRLRDRLAVLSAEGIAGENALVPAGYPAATRWWPRLMLVVEGAARAVEPVPGVEVVSADGSGDDAIVNVAAEVAPPGVVVTADRTLRERVRQRGADVAGPKSLLEILASP